MKLRKLNKKGLHEFELFIENLRNGGEQNTPDYLLTDLSTSDELEQSIELEKGNFTNRYQLGEYLAEKFSSIEMQSLIGDTGFWSAIALFWFDQLCPVKKNDARRPAMVYHYILSENYKHRPRHAIFTTWQLVDRYQEQALILLSGELPIRGELIEQLMARQYYLSCRGVMLAASAIYYDPERNTFKIGAAARKSAGCIARYINWLQQLEINYDLFSISCDDLIEIMPDEFDRFR